MPYAEFTGFPYKSEHDSILPTFLAMTIGITRKVGKLSGKLNNTTFSPVRTLQNFTT